MNCLNFSCVSSITEISSLTTMQVAVSSVECGLNVKPSLVKKHGVSAVRLVARGQETVNIADNGNGLPFVRLSESWRVGHFCHVAL